MTLPELNKRLDGVVNDLSGQAMGNMMVQAGSSALEMIRNRVVETGVNADGQKFAPYSNTPMLTNCSAMLDKGCAKIAGSKEKRKDLKWITLKRGSRNIKLFELPGGYKQFRELYGSGRRTDIVNFSLSGHMWTNIKLISVASEHTHGIARIGSMDEKTNDILEGNTERRGDILMLSQKELTEISELFGNNLQQSINKHGL